MVAGLARGRAPRSRLVLGPALAIPATAATAAAVALVDPLVHAMGIGASSFGQLAFGAVVAAAIGYGSGRLLARRPEAGSAHRRGAVVADSVQVEAERGAPRSDKREREPRVRGTAVYLAGVAVAPADETKHFKIIGTTGTGKSTAIRELLSAALGRGDGAVIADPDAAYLRDFYEPSRGDVVLNPFDTRSSKWDPFGEIKNEYDVDQLARSLIPDHGESDRSWSEYARTFFTAVVQQMHASGLGNAAELYRVLTRAPTDELRLMLEGTAAEPFLEAGNERMFGSVRSVTSSAVRGLKYVIAGHGRPFSIRRWVSEGVEARADGRGSVLFLPYKAGEIAALRSTISAWMRIAVFEAMDRPQGDQRLWFVVDELDALGEIDGLKDALARLRKFGGRAVLGFQSIAQVSGLYGRAAADTLVENCANTLILRCSASEHGGTSQFASRLIGEREVTRTTQSRTRSPSEWFGSTTMSEHIGIEPAVMASQIERLADLEGYLKLASVADWRRVKLSPATGIDSRGTPSDASRSYRAGADARARDAAPRFR
jgi:Type IV secretion-system coupling protein DNA-binding domain